MDARLQLRVQRYGWDAASDFYEAGWQRALAPAQTTLLALAAPRPGERVLEVACGSGLVTGRLADAVGPAGRVLATDLSQSMVDLTAARAAAGGLAMVSTARMNAEELAVEPGSFDLALCALGLMYVPDPRRALAAMARAVRSGGRVAATVWGERRRCGWAEIFPIVDQRVVSEVCPMFFATGAPQALVRDFEAAGLVVDAERRQDETLDYPSERALLDAMLIGGPVALAVKRFGPEVMAEVEREFASSVASFRTAGGGYAIPGEFVTVAAHRPV